MHMKTLQKEGESGQQKKETLMVLLAVPVNKHNHEGQMVCIWHKPPACELLFR